MMPPSVLPNFTHLSRSVALLRSRFGKFVEPLWNLNFQMIRLFPLTLSS